jgi:glycosyltransferase involved in cell wall biosynthesis
MKKIRVLEMIDRPSLGGGQTALLLLAENLDRGLFDVTVGSAPGGPLVDQTVEKGLRHLAVPLEKKFSLRSIGKIAAILGENEVDILHTHGGYAGLYGRWAARRSRTPVVVHTLHGIHYLHCRNPAVRRLFIHLERRCSRFTDRLILVSYADLGRAIKHRLAPQDRMSVILNGIALPEGPSSESREEKRRELNLKPGEAVVGTIARLHRQKGVLFLLLAAPMILDRFPEARIVIAGDGPLDKRLRQKARGLGLGDRVLFLGARTDAGEVLALFDIFVLPSLWEGLPFVLVEAAALGKPIVSTAVDGTSEVIDDGKTGILVPPRAPHALAEAVIALLADRNKASRLAERAKAVIPARFPLQRMVEQTQTLYLKLYQKKIQNSG